MMAPKLLGGQPAYLMIETITLAHSPTNWDDVIHRLSTELPDWAYIYDRGKPDANHNYHPVVLHHGEVLGFTAPATAAR